MFLALWWLFACGGEPEESPPSTFSNSLLVAPPQEGDIFCVKVLFKKDPGDLSSFGVAITSQKPGGAVEGIAQEIGREKLYQVAKRPDVLYVWPCREGQR